VIGKTNIDFEYDDYPDKIFGYDFITRRDAVRDILEIDKYGDLFNLEKMVFKERK